MSVNRKRGGSALPTPNERALADAIRRARTAKPTRGEQWYVKCGELADELGLNAGDVFERFDELAAIQEYDASNTRADAERIAFGHVVEIYRRQKALAV